MPLEDITQQNIKQAIDEFDRLGRIEFLQLYGYGPSKHIFLMHNGRQYDAKAIVGVAHQYASNGADPLPNRDFNSRNDAEPLLWKLGFDTVDKTLPPLETEYQRQVWLRKNQTKFSQPVKTYWGNRCAVTGIEAPSLLEACHIKPFSESGDEERLNPFNGLYLASHIHAAFDANLIGISPDGDVCMSDKLSSSDRKKLHLSDAPKIQVDQRHRPFLKYRYDEFKTVQNGNE